MYGGQMIRVLDMDTERDGVKIYSERTPSFTENATAEAAESTPQDKQNKFMTVFSEYSLTWRASTPERIIRLSLVGQDYICSKQQKKMILSNALMVFYLKNDKFVPLYEVRHLQTKKYYLYLDKKGLTAKLREVFQSVKLTLGQLHAPNLRCIAWKAETEEGIFYILWHNGCIIKAQDYLCFEEKKIEELRKVYNLLRFAPSVTKSDCYTVLCC